jgi:hypothetical protein
MSGGGAARRKGHDWERALVHRFAEVFGIERVRRGLQYRDGAECPDVEAPALWIEAKRGKRTNPRAALTQAKEASLGKGVWPIAVCKDDRHEPFVTMELDDFLDLLREWWATRGK